MMFEDDDLELCEHTDPGFTYCWRCQVADQLRSALQASTDDEGKA